MLHLIKTRTWPTCIMSPFLTWGEGNSGELQWGVIFGKFFDLPFIFINTNHHKWGEMCGKWETTILPTAIHSDGKNWGAASSVWSLSSDCGIPVSQSNIPIMLTVGARAIRITEFSYAELMSFPGSQWKLVSLFKQRSMFWVKGGLADYELSILCKKIFFQIEYHLFLKWLI